MYLAICEDDGNQSDNLKEQCTDALKIFGTLSPVTIHTYRSGEELITDLKAEACPKYDIIVMDIEFGENTINGIETARTLREMGITAPVVITTSYDIYWRQGYGLGIVRYLSKPVSEDQLFEALDACVKEINRSDGKEIVLKNGTEHTVVRYRDIMYFECCGHTVTANTKDKNKYSCNQTIGVLEKQAPGESFFKINKGILVNMRYAAYIKGPDLILDSGAVLPIAQRRRSQCMDFLRKYVKEQL